MATTPRIRDTRTGVRTRIDRQVRARQRIAPKPAAKQKKRLTFGRIVLRTFGVLTILSIVALCIAASWTWNLYKEIEQSLPPVRSDLASALPSTSFLYASDGTEIARIGSEFRIWADLSEIAPYVVDALIATEDRRFFEHTGVDFRRVVGAGMASFQGDPQGASTITMQLVRNTYPDIARMAIRDRKPREMLMAQRMEKVYSKTEILELYLNTIAFGHGAFGIEAAAQTYFSTTARELDVLEAALLVGMLKGPSYYDPLHDLERAKARRNIVLTSLVENQKIAPGVAASLQGDPVVLRPAKMPKLANVAPHFAEYVRREVARWGRDNGYDLYRDGLRVFTTIDPYMQRLAESVVARQIAPLQRQAARDWAGGGRDFGLFWATNASFESQLIRGSSTFEQLVESGMPADEAMYRLRSDLPFVDSLRTAASRIQTSFVALDPATGHIKAWLGSRDYETDQYDKVASARRQPGSTFKPILYAAALEAGYSPYHYAEDVVRTYRVPPFGETWRPTNSGGGASGRLLTLRQALSLSKNTVSARLVQEIRPSKVAGMARRLGIKSDLLSVPSIALGTSEVTLLEMVSAYGAFANGGVHKAPTAVVRIEDADGKVIANFIPGGTTAISSQHAYTLIDMLRDVVRPGGTGGRLAARFPVPGEWVGKTGTTQENTDGWFVALHPNLALGAWVGFNYPRLRFRDNTWGQGANNAGPIVADFLRRTVNDPMSGIGPNRFLPPPGYIPPSVPRDPFAGNLVEDPSVWLVQESDPVGTAADPDEPDRKKLAW